MSRRQLRSTSAARGGGGRPAPRRTTDREVGDRLARVFLAAQPAIEALMPVAVQQAGEVAFLVNDPTEHSAGNAMTAEQRTMQAEMVERAKGKPLVGIVPIETIASLVVDLDADDEIARLVASLDEDRDPSKMLILVTVGKAYSAAVVNPGTVLAQVAARRSPKVVQ